MALSGRFFFAYCRWDHQAQCAILNPWLCTVRDRPSAISCYTCTVTVVRESCVWQQKTTEQNRFNRIVRTGKSEAEVTDNKKTALEVLYYWSNEANYWQTRSIARPLCDSRATYTDEPLYIAFSWARCVTYLTAQQRTITQLYGDWYTGRWWVGCYIWYSEEEPGRAGAHQSPPRCTKCYTPPINGSVPTSYYLILCVRPIVRSGIFSAPAFSPPLREVG